MAGSGRPFGACPNCDGIGTIAYFDPDLVVPDAGKSLREGAIQPWTNTSSRYYQQALQGLASYYKFSVNKPYKELSKIRVETVLT